MEPVEPHHTSEQMQPQSEQPAAQPVTNGANHNHRTTKAIVWLTVILAILALLWLIYWLVYLQYHESTDDAYGNGSMINVNSAVSGSVVAFYADDTDLVEEGQLLVLLDQTDYRINYEKELADLSDTVLQVKRLYDSVLENQVNVANKKALFDKATFDFENRSRLIGTLAVSNEDFIHSRDDHKVAQLNYEQAQYQLKIAQDLAGDTIPSQHPLIEKQKASVKNAFYRLAHCKILAPATGYIAQRYVDVGEWVTSSTDLMAVIPTNYVWVDANFKETQLIYMRVGQPARIWLDMYGSDVEYKGKVLGIASGSGSVFSLIPPQNATGNWIKIVQRLPVRISLDAETVKKYPVRLGVSAYVDVNLENQDLPMLTLTPSKAVVGITPIFDLDFDEVHQKMNQIINSHFPEEKEHDF